MVAAMKKLYPSFTERGLSHKNLQLYTIQLWLEGLLTLERALGTIGNFYGARDGDPAQHISLLNKTRTGSDKCSSIAPSCSTFVLQNLPCGAHGQLECMGAGYYPIQANLQSKLGEVPHTPLAWLARGINVT
jgi:hypothetical protein